MFVHASQLLMQLHDLWAEATDSAVNAAEDDGRGMKRLLGEVLKPACFEKGPPMLRNTIGGSWTKCEQVVW